MTVFHPGENQRKSIAAHGITATQTPPSLCNQNLARENRLPAQQSVGCCESKRRGKNRVDDEEVGHLFAAGAGAAGATIAYEFV
jgi:hypothetical protein